MRIAQGLHQTARTIMPKGNQTAHTTTHQRHKLTAQEKHERKQRVLTQGTPSVTSSIADAVVVKNGNLFFLTEPDGKVPLGGNHGFGLYYNDCRYLSGYELRLAGAAPLCMVSTAERGYLAALQLTNFDIRMTDGTLIHKEEIGIRWDRLMDANKPALNELITLENFGAQNASFPLELTFEASFEDVFAIRGLLIEKLGRIHPPTWKDGVL